MRYKIRNINLENKRSRFFKRSVFVNGRRLRVGDTTIVEQDALDQLGKYVAYPGQKWERTHQIYAEPIDVPKAPAVVAAPAVETATGPNPPKAKGKKPAPPVVEHELEPAPEEPNVTLAEIDAITDAVEAEPESVDPAAEQIDYEETIVDLTDDELEAFPYEDGTHDIDASDKEEDQDAGEGGDAVQPKPKPKSKSKSKSKSKGKGKGKSAAKDSEDGPAE